MKIFTDLEKLIKQISAREYYNKEQLYKAYSNLPELIKYEAKFNDRSLIKKIISKIPATDFCRITNVKDCEVSKYSTCSCTRAMVFGDDEVNGKICERFITKTTSRNCNDGNFELAEGKCIVSSKAVSCEDILDLHGEILELKQKNQELMGKLNEWQEIAAGEL